MEYQRTNTNVVEVCSIQRFYSQAATAHGQMQGNKRKQKEDKGYIRTTASRPKQHPRTEQREKNATPPPSTLTIQLTIPPLALTATTTTNRDLSFLSSLQFRFGGNYPCQHSSVEDCSYVPASYFVSLSRQWHPLRKTQHLVRVVVTLRHSLLLDTTRRCDARVPSNASKPLSR